MAPRWADEQDEIQFSEPILAKKDCKVRIDFAEPAEWKVKETVPGHGGETYKAMKLTVIITDENVQTEHADAKPRLTIEHQLNIEKYPYLDKKTGTVKWLGRAGLYDLEAALGFEPRFVGPDGQQVEPYVTRTGRKAAPKIDGVKQMLNPDFAAAYFHEDGTVNPSNWIEKNVYADIDVERSDQYGDRNVIKRFKAAPPQV